MRRASAIAFLLAIGVCAPAEAAGLTGIVRDGTAAELTAAVAADLAALNRPDPHSGFAALTIAALRGDAAKVRLLLELGADTEAAGPHGMPALAAVARSCHADPVIVSALLAAGADPDARSGAGITPAQAALQAGRADIAALIIRAGADIDAVNRYGDGLLNFAIYFRQPRTIRLLLEKGVDTGQLGVLFTTERYYQMGFGFATMEARARQCANARPQGPD